MGVVLLGALALVLGIWWLLQGQGPTTTAQISEVDRATLVHVPAGEFLMGATKNDIEAYDDEKPQRRIHFGRFLD